ncbi:MAG TPA: hypothetical protein VH054_03865 [Polyangiaceae bacterium]|jgi:hypothetical protein|nr:hypothetical protein [Polyangiaceae bacterium]
MHLSKIALAAVMVLVSWRADASNCVPGAQTQCACPGGGSGVQICSDDGSRFGVCSNCTMPAPQTQMQMQPMQPMYMTQPPTRRSSPGLYAGGLVTMLISAILLPAGTGLIIGGAADDGCEKHDTGVCAGGGVMVGLGLLGLAGGIVMMVVGGQRVPLNAPQQAWWLPTTRPSPHGAALRWTF